MNSKQLIALWLTSGIITLIAIVIAAAAGDKALSATAAAMFALTSIICSWILNGRIAESPNSAAERRTTAQANAHMLAAVFCWGGTAILGGYYLTALFWHHAWQYGGAMLILAGGLTAYSRLLQSPASPWSSPKMLKLGGVLAALQACAAAIGLVFLLWSGKLDVNKPDWLANHVFLAGGLVVIVLSGLAARAQYRA